MFIRRLNFNLIFEMRKNGCRRHLELNWLKIESFGKDHLDESKRRSQMNDWTVKGCLARTINSHFVGKLRNVGDVFTNGPKMIKQPGWMNAYGFISIIIESKLLFSLNKWKMYLSTYIILIWYVQKLYAFSISNSNSIFFLLIFRVVCLERDIEVL